MDAQRAGKATLMPPIDLTGDARDEVVYTVGNELRIYTQDRSPEGPRVYAPDKRHWRSTLAVASYPGWR